MKFIIYYNLNFLTLSNFATNMGLDKPKIPYLKFSSYLFVTTGTMDGGHNNITWLLKNWHIGMLGNWEASVCFKHTLQHLIVALYYVLNSPTVILQFFFPHLQTQYCQNSSKFQNLKIITLYTRTLLF